MIETEQLRLLNKSYGGDIFCRLKPIELRVPNMLIIMYRCVDDGTPEGCKTGCTANKCKMSVMDKVS